MQSDNMKQEVKDLTTRIISLDPVEFDSAINQYFEANAVIENKTLYIRGASNIKKIAYFQSLLPSTSKLEGEPKYDEKSNLVTFTFSRTFNSHKLPYLGGFFPNKDRTIHWDARMHLYADEDGEAQGGEKSKGRKWYVTKVDGVERHEKFPFEFLIPFFLLRPVLSLLALSLAVIASFYQRHQKDNIIAFVFAALSESLQAIWGMLLAEGGKRQAEMDVWREKKRGQASDFYNQALLTASSLQSDLEARAKAAGIPIDQYKSQIHSTLQNLQSKAEQLQYDLEIRAKNANIPMEIYQGRIGDIFRNVESKMMELQGDLTGRAKKAGIPVEEYRKQVEQVIADLQKKAQSLGEYFDAKAGEAKAAADKTTNDTTNGGESRSRETTGSKAPLSGESSSANTNNTPSLVSANLTKATKTSSGAPKKKGNNNANSNSNANTNPWDQMNKENQTTTNGDFTNVPQTPLGGHDPTAANAPSFAAAAAQ